MPEQDKASWKALVPLIDHQVEGSVHHSGRGGNVLAEAKVEAEWAVVPRRGVPGSETKGAVAALATESVHRDLANVSVDKATVGRPGIT